MKRAYETIIVFDGSLADDVLVKEKEKFEKHLTDNFEFEKTVTWGRLPMAYEIRRKKVGMYHNFLYKSEANPTLSIEKELKLNSAALRWITVVRDESKPLSSPIDPEVIDRKTEQFANQENDNETTQER